jgi:hypothetical protein
MITALAFRIDTQNAAIFRQWLMERVMQPISNLWQSISVVIPVRENRQPN